MPEVNIDWRLYEQSQATKYCLFNALKKELDIEGTVIYYADELKFSDLMYNKEKNLGFTLFDLEQMVYNEEEFIVFPFKKENITTKKVEYFL